MDFEIALWAATAAGESVAEGTDKAGVMNDAGLPPPIAAAVAAATPEFGTVDAGTDELDGVDPDDVEVDAPGKAPCNNCSICVTSLSSLNCASCPTNVDGSRGLVGS